MERKYFNPLSFSTYSRVGFKCTQFLPRCVQEWAEMGMNVYGEISAHAFLAGLILPALPGTDEWWGLLGINSTGTNPRDSELIVYNRPQGRNFLKSFQCREPKEAKVLLCFPHSCRTERLPPTNLWVHFAHKTPVQQLE